MTNPTWQAHLPVKQVFFFFPFFFCGLMVTQSFLYSWYTLYVHPIYFWAWSRWILNFISFSTPTKIFFSVAFTITPVQTKKAATRTSKILATLHTAVSRYPVSDEDTKLRNIMSMNVHTALAMNHKRWLMAVSLAFWMRGRRSLNTWSRLTSGSALGPLVAESEIE